MTLSDRIVERNAGILDRMLHHRFVEDVCADRLPRDVFRRYLAYEGAFVNTAMSIFAYAVARAPDISSRRRLIGVLDTLANAQVPFFEERYRTLGIAPPHRLPPEAAAFDGAMQELAENEGFPEIITAMFAAEWMYWQWSKRAICCRLSDPDVRAWVALHVTEEFAAQANWLKNAIDLYGSPAEVPRLVAIFARVTELEIRFHHAPYAEPGGHLDPSP